MLVSQSRMFLNPIVNLLLLPPIELVEYFSAFNAIVICAICSLHHVVKGDDYEHGQNVHAEKGCVANAPLIVLHEHGTYETTFVFNTVVEQISELFHESWLDGNLVLVL